MIQRVFKNYSKYRANGWFGFIILRLDLLERYFKMRSHIYLCAIHVLTIFVTHDCILSVFIISYSLFLYEKASVKGALLKFINIQYLKSISHKMTDTFDDFAILSNRDSQPILHYIYTNNNSFSYTQSCKNILKPYNNSKSVCQVLRLSAAMSLEHCK